MNKKYDYMKLLCDFNSDQLRLYNVCTLNIELFKGMIYKTIVTSTSLNKEVFQEGPFKEWLSLSLSTDNVTHLESTIISWIHDYPEFFDFYKGDWSVQSVLNSVIKSWQNKPKSLRLCKLGMLYSNYMSFLQTTKGYTFMYGTSFYDLQNTPEEPEYSDTSFFETESYKMMMLNECKCKVLDKVSSSVTDKEKRVETICEANAIWKAIFVGGHFSYSKAIVFAKADPDNVGKTDAQIRRNLKRIHIKVLEALLSDNLLEKYFDDAYITVNGVNYSLRDALQIQLNQLIKEVGKVAKFRPRKSINNLTKDEIRLVIENFCRDYGVVHSYSTGHPNGLAKLKIDAALGRHKTYKVYIYNGGAYKDFYSGKSGFITDIIPMRYFDIVCCY